MTLIDRWHLLPRSYVWGLADTLAQGFRGHESEIFAFGKIFRTGEIPLFTWPGFVVVKLPLVAMALAVVGVVGIVRSPTLAKHRGALLALLAFALLHLVFLMRGNSHYAGIRHALPVVLAAQSMLESVE
jgi:hypothetical protein